MTDGPEQDAPAAAPEELSRLGRALQVGIPILSGVLAIMFAVQLFIEGRGPGGGNVFFLVALVAICVISAVWWRRDARARVAQAGVDSAAAERDAEVDDLSE